MWIDNSIDKQTGKWINRLLEEFDKWKNKGIDKVDE